jgi:uncharacterized protein (DUF849 family)
MSDKIAITVAITGSLSKKGDKKGESPYIPITPDELAQETIRSYEAGATIVHIHVRDPKTTGASSDLNLYKETVSKIKAKCPIIINTTTGGGMGMSDEERIAVVPTIKPDMASLNCGSLTYGIYGGEPGKWMLDYPWANSFKSMEYYARTMMENNCKPELEIYDNAMLSVVRILVDAGAIAPPPHFQFVMGLPGQVVEPTPRALLHLADTVRDNFPKATFSVCAAGRQEFPMVTMGAIIGATNIRVGLEDNIYLDHGVLAKSNADLVEKAAKLATLVGRSIANVDEARQLLGLPAKK